MVLVVGVAGVAWFGGPGLVVLVAVGFESGFHAVLEAGEGWGVTIRVDSRFEEGTTRRDVINA